MKKKTKIILTSVAATSVASGLLAGLYATYRIAFHSPKGNQNDDFEYRFTDQTRPMSYKIFRMIGEMHAKEYEKVSITSFDGLKLIGRYYEVTPGAPLCICVHGYRGTPARDFSGGAPMLMEMGYNVLMPEQRGTGESEGHTITFGIRESKDVRSWVDYAVRRFGSDTKICLVGISMGGTSVLMSAAEELPANVKGIAADCPFDSPVRIIRDVAKKNAPLVGLLAGPAARMAAILFGHFRLGKLTAADGAAASKVPILLIHGEQDRFVPEFMSRRIAEANPEMVTRVTFPGAGHGISYLVDEDRYKKITGDFLKKIFA
ncbi:MAG: alpha/beta fold hydrolase [Firmicutes bacterium]|nr:alpha/beta fold hydrolase [Bacillota bacterium]